MVSDGLCRSEAPTELVRVAGENCELNVGTGVRVVVYSDRGVVVVCCGDVLVCVVVMEFGDGDVHVVCGGSGEEVACDRDVAVCEVLVVVREGSEEQ